jgi:hypothetical protein
MRMQPLKHTLPLRTGSPLVPSLAFHNNPHRHRVNPKLPILQHLLDIIPVLFACEELAHARLATDGDGGGDGAGFVEEAEVASFGPVEELDCQGEEGEDEETDGKEVG